MNDALLPLQIKMYAYNAFPVPLAARLHTPLIWRPSLPKYNYTSSLSFPDPHLLPHERGSGLASFPGSPSSAHAIIIRMTFDPRAQKSGGSSLVTRPHPHPKRERGSGIIIITSEFLVVLSQHVRKTGNPIRLLDLLKSCDMKEN